MSKDKNGFLHPFINYLIESKQLEIIIEEYSERFPTEEESKVTK